MAGKPSEAGRKQRIRQLQLWLIAVELLLLGEPHRAENERIRICCLKIGPQNDFFHFSPARASVEEVTSLSFPFLFRVCHIIFRVVDLLLPCRFALL